jgi:hypothetical protein
MWAGQGEAPKLDEMHIIDARQMFGETAAEAMFKRPGSSGGEHGVQDPDSLLAAGEGRASA